MNGKNIIKYREDNGISQIELANEIGVARSTLSRWEQNKTVPRGEDYDHLRKIIGDEYITDEDLTEDKTAIEAIEVVSDRVDNILFQVTQIESNQRSFENEDNKSKLKHRRIRTVAIIVTCIIILAIVIGTWFYLMNYGFGGDIVEGSVGIEDVDGSYKENIGDGHSSFDNAFGCFLRCGICREQR